MVLKNVGLRRLTTGMIIFGIIIGLTAPALELYNVISKSNKIIIAFEVLLLTFFLVESLVLKNGTKWKHSILIGLPILIVDIFARIFNLYQRIEGFGYFGHFWIGIALIAILMLVYNKKFKFIIWFNLSLAFLWELAEIIQDKIFASITPLWLIDTYWDGLLDITLTIVGTLVGYYLIKRYYKK